MVEIGKKIGQFTFLAPWSSIAAWTIFSKIHLESWRPYAGYAGSQRQHNYPSQSNAAQNNSYEVEHQYRGSGKVFNFWRTIAPRMVESPAVLGVIPKAKYKLACITVYLSPHPTLRLRTLREAPFWNLLGLYGHCQNSCRPPPPQRRAGGYSLFLTMGCFLRWDV